MISRSIPQVGMVEIMVNRRSLPIVAWCIVASVVTTSMVLRFDDGVLGNDYAQMISVARNIVIGVGVKTDLVYYDVHYALGGTTVPQTVFPPGQALLNALLMSIGVPGDRAAFVWCLVAFLGSGLLLLLTMRRIALSNTVIVFGGLSWLIIGVNWSNVLFCRSETLFIAMTVIGLYAFVRWATGAGQSRLPLVALGSAAALAFLFRYQGLFFVTAVGGYFALRVLFHRNSSSLQDLITVAVIPGATILSVWIYNFLVAGGIGGGPVDHTRHSAGMLSVLRGYYWEISKILGVSRDALLAGGASEIIGLLLLGLIIVAVFRLKGRSRRWSDSASQQLAAFCALYVGISGAAFVYLSLTKSIGYTQARYLSTLLPFAIVLLAIMTHQVKVWARPGPKFRILALVLATGFIGFGQARAIGEQLAFVASDSRLRDVRQALQSSGPEGQPVGEFLKAEIDAGRYVLANQSQLTGHILERPTFGFTPSLFTDRVFDNDEVDEMARKNGIRYVVLFPELYDPAAVQNRNRVILTELMRGNRPEWLTPVMEQPSVKVYKINTEMMSHQ